MAASWEGKPWEMQPGETDRAFHAFCHYRDMDAHSRSVAKAIVVHESVCLNNSSAINHPPNPRHSTFKNWSHKYRWVARAAEWDREQDRIALKAQADVLRKTKERHAQVAAGYIAVLSSAVKAAADALADPNALKRMAEAAKGDPEKLGKLLDRLARHAGVIQSLVNVERLSRGMATEAVEVSDKRESQIADAVSEDPEARAAALKLFEIVAKGETRDDR